MKITKDEIRINDDKEYNISAMKRYKEELLAEKKAGVKLIEDKDYPQEVKELVELENERRRMRFDDIDSLLSNLESSIDAYSKLTLK